jgi:hypothetical protein
MTARDLSQETVAPETAPEVIAPGPAEAEAASKFTAEGALPEVAPEVAAAPPATASELAFENKGPENNVSVINGEHGMVTWEQYKRDCEVLGKSEEWKDEYVDGHTEAVGWLQPKDHWNDNVFLLKQNTSATSALKAFLAGPTITNWQGAQVATDLEDLLREIGEKKFDLLFGSAHLGEDAAIPATQRLRISAHDLTSTYIDQLEEAVAQYDAREAEPVHPEELLGPQLADAPKPEKPAPEDELMAQQLDVVQEQPEVV